MNDSFNGCTYTDVWASPKNWATITSKAALKKDWYVQANFYDPKYAVQNGKDGFQFRRRFNKFKTLELRQAAINKALADMADVLSKGFNPITGQFMAPPVMKTINRNPLYNTETPIKNALDLAFNLSTLEPGPHRTDVKTVKRNFKKALRGIGYHTMRVGEFTTLQVRQTIDYMLKNIISLGDKRYNRYKTHLSGLFTILRKNGLISGNPVENIDRKKTVVSQRTTLTISERRRIDVHLRNTLPNFWVFTNIFYHSGGREIELLRLQPKDVDLKRLIYKTLIKKGGSQVWIERPIKKIAIDFWLRALDGSRKEDYIFSEGLRPGPEMIRREQITRRWKTHVKNKLGIAADFYSLKHSNLDEITERLDLKAAARAAGHTNTRMVKQHYAVNEEQRQLKAVQNMKNSFAPESKHNNILGNCPPTPFMFKSSHSVV